VLCFACFQVFDLCSELTDRKYDTRVKKDRFVYYGWIIVAAGILSYSLGYGARYSFSVIFPSLLTDFGWSRDLTASVLSSHMLMYGLVAPVAGGLVDRIGPRKTMGLGTVLLGLGLAFSAMGTSPWHFYFSFGVLTGAGLCLIGAVPFTTVLKNWFERKRGLAFSLLFFGVGGGFASYPGIAFLINRFGWRNTLFIEALIIIGFLLPVLILTVRYHPRELGLFADGTPNPTKNSSPTAKTLSLVKNPAWTAINWNLPKAVRTGRFWLLCLSTFCLWGIVQHIMVTHHIAFAMDLGFSKIYASSVLSLFGILFACGSLAGVISDWIGRETTMTVSAFVGISGILALMHMNDTSQGWLLYYYAITFGFSIGMTGPVIAAAVTDIFQGPRVGAAIGCIWFSFAIGGCIGPWLGGWVFELTHTYQAAFMVSLAVNVVGCAAIWMAAPRKVRAVPGRS